MSLIQEHSRRARRRRALTAVAVSLVTAGVFTSPSEAQRRGPAPRQAASRRAPAELRANALIETSAPVANLFARADEGIARRDWKFAVDSLQRIIDDPDGSLICRNGDDECLVYESTRRHAIRQIAQLPAEGLRAYRVLNDGKAKRLFEQGRASSDPEPLRRLVETYLPTSYGDDAGDLLASWALDQGRPADAIRLLSDVRELTPEPDVPAELIVAKLAAAYVMLGRKDKAEALIASYTRSAAETGAPAPERGGAAGVRGANEDAAGATWLASIASAVGALDETRRDEAHAAGLWPTRGGSSARLGQMEPVAPDLVPHVPWKFDMPGAGDAKWERMLASEPRDALAVPASHLVADGARVFVRTQFGCAALDIENLSVVWNNPVEDAQGEPRSGTRTRFVVQEPGPPTLRERLFEDYVGESLAVSHGLLLSVQPHRVATEASQGLRFDVLPAPRSIDRRGDARSEPPNVVIAYDSATGAVRWQRGQTYNVADTLGTVSFRSAPVEVGDELWVPYWRQGDLLVGILEPEDGSLIEEIHLHSLDGPKDPSHAALMPAYADGAVFIASEYGVLFAVDSQARRLRWANRFEGAAAKAQSAQQDVWLVSAPVTVGGLVLVAPYGRTELLAYDAASGDLAWSQAVTDAGYIVAADAEHVWTGGKSISCFTLSDGEELWHRETGEVASGRAVLSGATLYVPTRAGLLSFQANTGDRLGLDSMPETGRPPGNLLCIRSSLLSVDPNGVRRFPDIDGLYPGALELHQRDPGDVKAATQLAWLEILRNEPRQALQVLDGLEEARAGMGGTLPPSAASVHVEALLKLADELHARGESETDSQEAAEMLKRAMAVARSPDDRLRSGLAMGEHLAQVGRFGESYLTLWELGSSDAADVRVQMDEEVRVAGRWKIARRLEGLRERLDEADHRAIQSHIDGEMARLAELLATEAGASSAAARLRNASDLPASGPGRQRALLELASWHLRSAQHAPAEQLLRELVRIDSDPSMTTLGLMRLAELYADPRQNLRERVGACVDLINDRAGAGRVPAANDTHAETDGAGKAAESPTAAGGASASQDVQTAAIRKWLNDFRTTHGFLSGGESGRKPAAARDVSGLLRAHVPVGPFVLSGEVPWSLRVTLRASPSRTFAPFAVPEEMGRSLAYWDHAGTPRRIELAGDGADALRDRAIFYAPGDVLYCQRLSDGELLWHTVLRLPDELSDYLPSAGALPVGRSRRAVVDGQTGVFAGMYALHAVGLVTGKQLWIRPFHFSGFSGTPPVQNPPIAGGAGLLAAVEGSDHVVLLRIADGTEVWKRDLQGEDVARIWLTDNAVITADYSLERVLILDRENGTGIGKVLFRQPDTESAVAAGLVRTKGVLCGPVCTAKADEVVAVDEATGDLAWRATLDKPLAYLFQPAEGYVGVGLLGGDLRVLDAGTGKYVFQGTVPHTNTAFDALLSGDLLIAKHVERGQSRPALTAFDMRSQEPIWNRNDLARTMGSVDMTAIGGALLVVVQDENPPASTGPQRGESVALIDLQSGVNVGPTVEIPFSAGGANFNGDLSVFDGSVIAGTTHGIHSFSTRPVDEADEERGSW